MRLGDRPTGRAHPFYFGVEQLPAPLFGEPFEIPFQDRILHLYSLRIGGFWVK
jgi:hypothetical protein